MSREGATVVVEQSGDAVLGALRRPINVTFAIREFPPDRLESRALAGSLRALYSTYTLAAADHGIRLIYDGRVTLGFAFFGVSRRTTATAGRAKRIARARAATARQPQPLALSQ